MSQDNLLENIEFDSEGIESSEKTQHLDRYIFLGFLDVHTVYAR